MAGVTISGIRAEFYKDHDWFGKMDPFLVFMAPDGAKVKTAVAQDAGMQAAWSAPLHLNTQASSIGVTAKNKKLGGVNKTFGTGSMTTDYAGQGPQTVILASADGTDVGEVTLELELDGGSRVPSGTRAEAVGGGDSGSQLGRS